MIGAVVSGFDETSDSANMNDIGNSGIDPRYERDSRHECSKFSTDRYLREKYHLLLYLLHLPWSAAFLFLMYLPV